MILVILKTPDGAEIEMEYDTDINLVRGLQGITDLICRCGGLKQAIEWSERAAREGLMNGGNR